MTNTKTFVSWCSMKNRCLNPNSTGYKYWGGRGIKICDRWLGKNGFQNFLVDMGERPIGKSLDRIDSGKGYYKENCRWANSEQQNNNSRKNHLLTYQNKTQTVAQWAKELNINNYIIYARIRRGWSIKMALTRKKGKYVYAKKY